MIYRPYKILRSIPFPGHTETWVICMAETCWSGARTIDCRRSQAFFERHFFSHHYEGKYIYITLPAPNHPWAEINPENGHTLDALFSIYVGNLEVDVEKLIPSLAGKQFAYCEQCFFMAKNSPVKPQEIQRKALGMVADHMILAGDAFNYLQKQTNKLLEKAFKGS